MAGKGDPISPRTSGGWMRWVFAGAWVAMAGCGIDPSAPSQNPQPMASQERFLQSLVDRNFQDPEAHYQLGEFYHAEGLWDRAQYQLDLAINFAPGFRKAQVALVRLLLDKGDRKAADATVEKFMRQLGNSPADLVDLAKAFEGAGLDQYALACLTEAARVSPTSAQPFKELGLYWKAKKDTAKAKQYLTRSLEQDPTQADVAEALGELGVVVEVPRTQPSAALAPRK
jgi:tetratricopeptide (TPR) repeat protein